MSSKTMHPTNKQRQSCRGRSEPKSRLSSEYTTQVREGGVDTPRKCLHGGERRPQASPLLAPTKDGFGMSQTFHPFMRGPGGAHLPCFAPLPLQDLDITVGGVAVHSNTATMASSSMLHDTAHPVTRPTKPKVLVVAPSITTFNTPHATSIAGGSHSSLSPPAEPWCLATTIVWCRHASLSP